MKGVSNLDMGQSLLQVLKPQIQALVKGLKHKHMYLCIEVIEAHIQAPHNCFNHKQQHFG